jgi:putative FmdB family regulatory protein
MPTYEYVCDACGHEFDELQSFSDEPLTKCPKCKKKKLRRLFGTGASIIFKGSGFYETDYRSESYKAGAKKDEEAAKPASESKSDSKTETKAETKTETKAETKSAGTKGAKAKSGKGDK